MSSLTLSWSFARPAAASPAPWLALASFATVTQALMVPGLLPGLADSLGTSVAEAGQATTAFALAAAVGAIPLARLSAGFDGRRVVVCGLLALAVLNGAAAFVETLPALLVLRVFSGLLAALVLPAAPALAAGLAGPVGRVRALAAVTGGSTAAFALGLPAASLLAGALGWQAAFALTALLCAGAAAVLAERLGVWRRPHPALSRGERVLRASGAEPSPPGRGQGEGLSALRTPGVIATLLLVLLAFASVFATHAFLGPIAAATASTSPATLQAMVAVGAIAGVPAGAAIAAHRRAPAMVAGVLLVAALAQWGLLAGGLVSPLLQLGVVALASAALFAVSPVLQARLVGFAPDARALVLAANFVAVSLGQAAGAALGGLALDAAGLTGAAAAGVIAAAAMLMLAVRPVSR